MLLRVSSNQQLEADGDLTIQRQIVKEYIKRQADWCLDSKEYFEGSNSGYKNSVQERDVLQEALQDACNGEYDILAAYKDDRIGRRMWEIGAYVMQLKSYGVDIYTVKDGCISPDRDDIMGQMMLALRYGNAQKSSADTGVRVKDTAQKLVQKGKFMGGCAPYGYQLVLSGEISKHGRALHKLVIVPKQAAVVKYIYELSLYKEYGSQKIARILNEHEVFRYLAPKTVWKSGTVTSILTNPIYTGHMAYKRRESVNGTYRRMESKDWIISLHANEDIRVIDDETWNRTQEKRRLRGNKYIPSGYPNMTHSFGAVQKGIPSGHPNMTHSFGVVQKGIKRKEPVSEKVIGRNDGMLALADVAYCGYCKGRLVNGSKYNYWSIKSTGEKKTSRTPIYKCRNAAQGIPHPETKQYRADKIESIVFAIIAKCIDKLQDDVDILTEIARICEKEKKERENKWKKEEQKFTDLNKKIAVMENNIPNAMTGEYPLTLEELTEIIRKQRQQAKVLFERICQKKRESESSVFVNELEDMFKKIPAWQAVFLDADRSVKRVLLNCLIDSIYVKKDEIVIRFQINLDKDFPWPGISGDSGVPE